MHWYKRKGTVRKELNYIAHIGIRGRLQAKLYYQREGSGW